ncbi:MAG: radical SAM protein [Methanobacteriota archaeon]
MGETRVLEVEAKSALTLCRIPEEPWSLNPYVGCAHACAYCYVPDVAEVERPNWGSYVIVKKNLPTVLSRELRRKERRDVFLSSATDPYQPVEHEHGVTRRCLEVLARTDWPVRVLTRSPLVRRDVDLFSRLSDVEVGLSVPTLDDEARAAVEPHAPPIAGRLRALRELAERGIPTYANLAPCYPLTGGVAPRDVAETFRAAGVRFVYAGAWGYLDGVLPALREHVDGSAFEGFVEAVQDETYYDRTFRALRREFERVGVDFKAG